MIDLDDIGAVYDMKGLLVTALKRLPDRSGVLVLVLEDNTGFTKRLQPGSVFPLLMTSPYSRLCKKLASGKRRGNVGS